MQNICLHKIERSLLTIDSSIRSGQFVYALRENNKLLSELIKENNSTKFNELILSLKKTGLYLKNLISPYSQNQHSINIIRSIKCQKK